MGGVGYYRKFLPELSKRIRSLTALLRKGIRLDFTPDMEVIVREILAALAAPPMLIFPDWDAVAAPSTCIATPLSTVLVPRSNRNNRTARYGQLLISAALPSIPRNARPRRTWKLVACLGHQKTPRLPMGNEASPIFGPRIPSEHRQFWGP